MTGASPERARRADIQGLRALAVAGVIAAHLTGWPASGYLGVDVFFVVSGFVITGLLLRERDRTGRTRMRTFYARRARRILPLALLVLALTVAASAWAYSGPRLDEIRTDALWAALFAANWRFAAVGTDYFSLGQTPSPVQHFWSLGVEEQFYLVWPWLFAAAAVVGMRVARNRVRATVARRQRRRRGRLAAVGRRPDRRRRDDRVLLHGDSGLGAGCWAPRWPACPSAVVRLPSWTRGLLSWLGLAVVAASFAVLGDVTPPYPAAVLPVVGALAVLLAGVGAPVRSAVLLTNPLSRYLGDISYGLYLWHFPLVVLLPVLILPSPPNASSSSC